MWNLRPRRRKPGPDDLWLSASVQGIALYRRRFSRAAFIPPACRPDRYASGTNFLRIVGKNSVTVGCTGNASRST